MQSNPLSPHELKAWQTGGVHVRVFGIEIETCEQCGGKVKVIASIEDPTVIGRILGHRASRALPAGSRPPSRGPPQGELELP